MLGLKGKMNHFQLKHIPYRSTLSDANKRRSHLVFQDVYYSLLKEYHPIISDGRQSYAWTMQLQAVKCNVQTLKTTYLSNDLKYQTSWYSDLTSTFYREFWFYSNQLKKSAVRKQIDRKSSYFYSCNFVGKNQITLKREIF